MKKPVKINDYYPEIKNVSNLLKSIFYYRKYSLEEVIKFLNEENEDFLDPFLIFDIKESIHKIENFIIKKSTIVIHGDFDADGVCATTILWDYLYRHRKANVIPLIPNRVDEGYGLSEKTIKKALSYKAELIITVDCGIKDIELISEYKNQVKFIVIDHHQFHTDKNGNVILPEADHVIHPLHPNSKFPNMISGTATVWQLIRAYEILYPSGKDINEYLDLVTISTICDIIPLVSENRKIFKKGINYIKNTKRKGLIELFKTSQLNPKQIKSYHIGYIIGPRLNAPGRILNDAMDSVRLLATQNQKQAIDLAQKIEDINKLRRKITDEFLQKAELEIQNNNDEKIILILGKEWPEGILGLIASKLAEKHKKPCFVATEKKDGKIVGSARSILEKLYLNKLLDYANSHLIKYGGHKQAAGFSSNVNIFKGFKEKILEYINLYLDDNDFDIFESIEVEIDNLNDISLEDIKELYKLEPFGYCNPKPIFLIKNVNVLSIEKFGKKETYIKFKIYKNNKNLIVKFFDIDSNQIKNIYVGDVVDIIGYFDLNYLNNNNNLEFIGINILINNKI